MENHIKYLKTRIYDTRRTIQELEKELDEAKKYCKHAFLKEDDGDSYYYICVHCEYTTRMKPIK